MSRFVIPSNEPKPSHALDLWGVRISHYRALIAFAALAVIGTVAYFS